MRSLLRCVDGDGMSRIDPFDAIQGPLGMMARARLEVMARLLLVASGGMALLWLISPHAYHQRNQPRAAFRNTGERIATRETPLTARVVRRSGISKLLQHNASQYICPEHKGTQRYLPLELSTV